VIILAKLPRIFISLFQRRLSGKIAADFVITVQSNTKTFLLFYFSFKKKRSKNEEVNSPYNKQQQMIEDLYLL
jgi:hypothetical protein